MSLRYEGLEFKVDGRNASSFRIDRVMGQSPAKARVNRILDTASFKNPSVTTDKNKDTLVHLGGLNLPIETISFDVENPYYFRAVEVWAADVDKEDAYRRVSGGTIYRVPNMNKSENVITCSLPQTRYVRLKIINRDNPALQVRKAEVAWFRQNLYFIPEAGKSYSLYFGDENLSTPDYEVGHFIPSDAAKRREFRQLAYGAVQKNPPYNPKAARPKKEAFEKNTLQVVILIIVAGMGFWAYRLMRNLKAGNT